MLRFDALFLDVLYLPRVTLIVPAAYVIVSYMSVSELNNYSLFTYL